MREIHYKDAGENKVQSYDDQDTPDLVGFNEFLYNKPTEALSKIKVFSKGKNVEVDLTTGDIKIDGNSVDLQLLPELKSQLNINNLRWINFRRVFLSLRCGGGKREEGTRAFGIGWQATIDGQSYKRYVLVTREGYTLETE